MKTTIFAIMALAFFLIGVVYVKEEPLLGLIFFTFGGFDLGFLTGIIMDKK